MWTLWKARLRVFQETADRAFLVRGLSSVHAERGLRNLGIDAVQVPLDGTLQEVLDIGVMFLTTSRMLVCAAVAIFWLPAGTRLGEQFVVSGAACDQGKVMSNGLRMLYWESFNITEVCVEAETKSPSTSRASFYVVAVFKGRGIDTVPVMVLVRTRSNATLGEGSFRDPRFVLRSSTIQFDLIAPGRSYQLVYPCDQTQPGCSYDGVVSRINENELLTLAHAGAVSGHALGADFELTQSGLEAVRTIASLMRR